MSTVLQPVNQSSYDELCDAQNRTQIASIEASAAAARTCRIRAGWAKPILHAVRCASELCAPAAPEAKSFDLWCDIAGVITDDPVAWEDVTGFAEASEEEISNTFGFGFVVGMMYSQITGVQLPIPNLPQKASPGAPQAD